MFVRFVYWFAVLVISLALVVGLVLYFESRDQSQVGGDSGASIVGLTA